MSITNRSMIVCMICHQFVSTRASPRTKASPDYSQFLPRFLLVYLRSYRVFPTAAVAFGTTLCNAVWNIGQCIVKSARQTSIIEIKVELDSNAHLLNEEIFSISHHSI